MSDENEITTGQVIAATITILWALLIACLWHAGLAYAMVISPHDTIPGIVAAQIGLLLFADPFLIALASWAINPS